MSTDYRNVLTDLIQNFFDINRLCVHILKIIFYSSQNAFVTSLILNLLRREINSKSAINNNSAKMILNLIDHRI